MSGSNGSKADQRSALDAKAPTGTKRGSDQRIGSPMIKAALTQKKVQLLFDYDPEKGVLRRRDGGYYWPRERSTPGYRMLRFGEHRATDAQVVWLWLYGEIPTFSIIPKDGDYSNLRPDNLSTPRRRFQEKLETPLQISETNRTPHKFKQGGPWKRPKVLPTQEQLQRAIEYDPDTGALISKYHRGGTTRVGSRLGYINANSGYRFLSFNGKLYPATRVIWCLVYGYWTEHEIDHINRIRDDDRLQNLREVARGCNQRNKVNSKNNNSGVKGVIYRPKDGWYIAQMTYNYRNMMLKCSRDFGEAVLYRWRAEVEFGYENALTDSPAYGYLLENNLITEEEAHEYSRIHKGTQVRV